MAWCGRRWASTDHYLSSAILELFWEENAARMNSSFYYERPSKTLTDTLMIQGCEFKFYWK